jgi:hypothetical protein
MPLGGSRPDEYTLLSVRVVFSRRPTSAGYYNNTIYQLLPITIRAQYKTTSSYSFLSPMAFGASTRMPLF